MSNSTTTEQRATEHRTLTLYCGDCGNPKVVKLKCSKRSCIECRRRIYWKLLKGWVELVKEMQHPKFLTVTIRNLPVITRDDVRRIRSQFIRLLRRKYYTTRIRGGIYVIELTNKGKGWHLHIHALIDTYNRSKGFLPWEKLKRDWLSITGTSMVVDIKEAVNTRGALEYILKYLVKPPEVYGQEDVYDDVMKGARLIQTFGTLYGEKPGRPQLACEKCGCCWWISEYQIHRLSTSLENEPRSCRSSFSQSKDFN